MTDPPLLNSTHTAWPRKRRWRRWSPTWWRRRRRGRTTSACTSTRTWPARCVLFALGRWQQACRSVGPSGVQGSVHPSIHSEKRGARPTPTPHLSSQTTPHSRATATPTRSFAARWTISSTRSWRCGTGPWCTASSRCWTRRGRSTTGCRATLRRSSLCSSSASACRCVGGACLVFMVGVHSAWLDTYSSPKKACTFDRPTIHLTNHHITIYRTADGLHQQRGPPALPQVRAAPQQLLGDAGRGAPLPPPAGLGRSVSPAVGWLT